jgi:hypothetical protein
MFLKKLNEFLVKFIIQLYQVWSISDSQFWGGGLLLSETPLKKRKWNKSDINSVLGLLQRVAVGYIVDISEVHSASIIRVEVTNNLKTEAIRIFETSATQANGVTAQEQN